MTVGITEPGKRRFLCRWLGATGVSAALAAVATLVVPTMVVSPAVSAAESRSPADDCGRLARIRLPDVEIRKVEAVAAGNYPAEVALDPERRSQLVRDVPAFCRIWASIHPTSDSNINIEVWMPLKGWNGKFLGIGNGGFSGRPFYPQMGSGLSRGYAVASTDTGHISGGEDAAWALGHPEKQIDFAHRAVHLMTVNAKEIVSAFYHQAPRYAYWEGCSSGGRQGLKEAQVYPDDYDGIVAGAPANWSTHLSAWGVYLSGTAQRDPEAFIPPEKYPLIHAAVMNRCDAIDGLKDGIINDPRQCTFRAADLNLQCKDGGTGDCLTAKQVALLDVVYGPMRDSSGRVIFPGLQPGTEMALQHLLGKGPSRFNLPVDHFKYIVHGDPDWDFNTFDVDRDVPKAVAKDRAIGFNANDPDLRRFKASGGKVLMWMGWNDNFIPPESSTMYYEQVQEKMGGVVTDFFRLFMIPGMLHCTGGGVPDHFDALTALENWVERDTVPTEMTAFQLRSNDPDWGASVVRSRPICLYPSVARYRGSGSIDDAANFSCVRSD